MQNKTKPKTTPRPDTRLWKELHTFAVAGLCLHDYNPRKVRRGLRVRLYHERSNPYDSNAIRVHLENDNRMLGYVPRCDTHILHRAKAQGCKFYAFVNQHFPGDNPFRMVWIKVKVLYPPVQQARTGLEEL